MRVQHEGEKDDGCEEDVSRVGDKSEEVADLKKYYKRLQNLSRPASKLFKSLKYVPQILTGPLECSIGLIKGRRAFLGNHTSEHYISCCEIQSFRRQNTHLPVLIPLAPVSILYINQAGSFENSRMEGKGKHTHWEHFPNLEAGC